MHALHCFVLLPEVVAPLTAAVGFINGYPIQPASLCMHAAMACAACTTIHTSCKVLNHAAAMLVFKHSKDFQQSMQAPRRLCRTSKSAGV